MDFAQVLVVLWQRRGWVLLGLGLAAVIALSTGYRFGLFPPSLEPKALALGTADTQIFVDSPRSALTDLRKGFEPLAIRANIYARFMTSLPVRRAIARELGVDPSLIETSAPLNADVQKSASEPTSAQRSQQLLGENLGYRVRFAADPGQPTVTITAQANKGEDAVRLANGAAVGFIKYINSIESRERIPANRQVKLRQLGSAEGGVVGASVNKGLAFVVFMVAAIGWCILVVLGASVAESLRAVRRDGHNGSDDNGVADGGT